MKRVLLGSVAVLVSTIAIADRAMAQVVSDNTLGTQVTQTGLVFGINNGTRSGNNLFHSFSQFSVSTGGSAIFNNATDVQNIFSRVTGSQFSNINGILKTQGGANLFLMNPNGIIFGPNARLQLGGSLLGTTASGIKFADGIEFNTVNAAPPLLSVNLPIGLQMGRQPGSIQVNGTGHRLLSPAILGTPYLSTGTIAGLSVQPGKTLALVGGPINLVGGILMVDGGIIELASLGSMETAELKVAKPFWTVNTTNTQRFSDITLSNRSIVDASGAGAGSIQVQGQNVRLTEGSLLFIQNRGTVPAGDINIKADALDVIGGLANRNIRSVIMSETRSGNSGNISVTARQINLMDGGSLSSRTFGVGASGTITINSSESVKMTGYVAGNPELISTIATLSFSPSITGRSGSISISTPSLSLQQGAIISVTTFGNAVAGNININADRIDVNGSSPSSFGPSSIASSTLGQGNAGNISLKTRSLGLNDRGTINTSSYTNGNAGSIIINASESIDVGNRSDIASGVVPNNPLAIAALNLPLRPRGNAGSILITAPSVRVRDQGRIIVANTGLGNSGQVNITANQILLNQQAQITAATVLGEGGNVVLDAQSLVLRQGSRITATAGGSGNGGNITIDSPIIVGIGNSDIVANAVNGKGGTIKIKTQSLFGLQYRTALTAGNDITASSEFGRNGNVQVNTIGINPVNSLNVLPTDITDSSRQITDRCGDSKMSSFIVTGHGGLSNNPLHRLKNTRSWGDLRIMDGTHSSVITSVELNHSLSTLMDTRPIPFQIVATCSSNKS
jgi:filamentous hemagglutinin family protein